MKPTVLSLLALSGLIAGCGSTIPAGSKGVFRDYFGGTKEAAYDDGFRWHWPWNNVTNYDVRWKTYSEKLNILSADNLHMSVDVALRMRPAPLEVYRLHTETGPEYYPRVVQQPFRAVTLEVLSTYPYNDIPKKTVEIQGRILAQTRQALGGKHLDFDEVEVRHVEYPERVIEAANEKLATQELAEQKEYEKWIAEAEAQIQIIQAKGQQAAQDIIQSTLTPMFLQFQAIEVQRQLARSPNAVFYFVPLGRDGLPFIVETPVPKAGTAAGAGASANQPKAEGSAGDADETAPAAPDLSWVTGPLPAGPPAPQAQP